MTSASAIELRPTSTPLGDEARRELMKSLGFGQVFTEHMVRIPYEEGKGWGRAVLCPYGPIQLMPATSVLHYGQAIFEGFKAYRQPDGGIKTYRPEMNARRLNHSARRLAMPEIPEELFIAAADALIRQDQAWVPDALGESLYLRPLMFATDCALGVRPSHNYEFFVFGSPASNYFPRGLQPVTVWLSEEYVRACPGGTGDAKFAGNYAASLAAQKQAHGEGCDQVVWLDAINRRFIEEMGGMNIVFVYRDAASTTLVTPELTGTLLEGVTRDGLLTLAPSLGLKVQERRVSAEEWQADAKSGKLAEAFACGTAAVITPIGAAKWRRGSWTMGDGKTGPVTAKLRETLLDIQHGRAPDPYGWMHKVV